MTTLRQMYISAARRHNWKLLHLKALGMDGVIPMLRELRNDMMRRARNAQEIR